MESAAVKRFFELNKDEEKVVSALSILIKLIENAQAGNPDRRRIRLGNKKIQEQVVSQIGAVDILLKAGFEKKNEDGECLLVYNPTKANSVSDVVRQLTRRLARFEASPAAARKHETSFLTAGESKQRQELARAKRKAQKAAKELAMKRFSEDKEARAEIAARQTRAKQAAIESGKGSFAPGPDVQVRRLPTTENNAIPTPPKQKPMSDVSLGTQPEPNHPKQPPSDADVHKGAQKMPHSLPESCDQKQPAKGAASNDQTSPMDVEKDTNPTSTDDSGNVVDDATWMEYLKRIPLCDSAEKIRETSIYWNSSKPSSFLASKSPLKRLLKELDKMKDSLPHDPRCTIWVRFDDETPQYIRTIITAALPGPTPYSGGLFCFDVFVPDDYPVRPPKVTLLTTLGGTIRFGPNLYKDGKVCLSLLGTWPGPKWNPRVSNLSQVFISIQGLILGVEHPYFLEPGHGGWEGTVKEGDFATTGQTLSGKIVKEDFFLPRQAAVYEDNLRAGTIRAMLEMIRSSKKQTSLTRYLAPFNMPIRAHFYHNQGLILNEVESWVNSCSGRSFAAAKPIFSQPSNDSSHRLQKLSSVLKTELAVLDPPPSTDPVACAPIQFAGNDAADEEEVAKNVDHPDFTSMELDNRKGEAKKAAAVVAKDRGSDDKVELEGQDKDGEVDAVESLKKLMNEAAQSSNYVTAGKLQAEITELEGLRRAMKDAAEKGNFIRAGKLQEQFEARLCAVKESPDVEPKLGANVQLGDGYEGDDIDMYDEGDDMDDEVDFDEDDDFDGPPPPGAGFPPGMGSLPQYPKNWFSPAGSKNRAANRNHQWGGGRTLTATTGLAVEKTPASSARVASSDTTLRGAACRLRIRLPNAKTLDEGFDSNATIGDVYRRINPHIAQLQDKDYSNKNIHIAPTMTRTQVATPYGLDMVESPAFSKPFSTNGYTLLLKPKREVSLEMDGTKSVQEMGLVPSAVVTVMMSKERGMVRRGDLEGRFENAQGDAMDVEGLSYEGLLELTERVGKSETPWTDEDEIALNGKTTLLSPAVHLASLIGKKSDGADDEDDDDDEQQRQCPICFGDFDSAETGKILRRLDNCRHSNNTFHEACLRTWMKINVGCPICKQRLTHEQK